MLTTPIYASILGLMFVALSIRTLLLRRQLQVSIGDGDQPILTRAIRVHAIGVSQVKEVFRYRVVGMVITFTVIISASFGLMISHSLNLFN